MAVMAVIFTTHPGHISSSSTLEKGIYVSFVFSTRTALSSAQRSDMYLKREGELSKGPTQTAFKCTVIICSFN